MDTVESKLTKVKEEIKSISSFINKHPKQDLQKRLDRCLLCLGHYTIEHPEHIERIDFLKEHTWSLIEKLSRRII